MKNKIIKSLALVLSGAMILSSIPVNVFADDDDDEEIEYQDSDDEEFTNNTGVNAEIGSAYKVTIPKVIVLSGATKQAAYYVKVEGDVAGTETVKVIPDATFNLYTENKAQQEASVVQDKTEWKVADFTTNAAGIVKALGLTAGKWSGAFNFNINLDNVLGDVDEPEHPEPVHTHTPADAVQENVVAATCTKEGSYDEVVYCSVCGGEISRITKTIAATDHNAGTPVKENIVEATTESEGSYDMVTYCTKCGAELSRSVVTIQRLVPEYEEITLRNDDLQHLGYSIGGNGSVIGFMYKDGEIVSDLEIPETFVYEGKHYRVVATNIVVKGLKSIKFPNSVKKIGGEMPELESIVFPDHLETIVSNYAFQRCKMSELVLPNTIKEIGANQNMSGIGCFSYGEFSSVTLPEGLEYIGSCAFSCCNNLTSVTIPSTLKTPPRQFDDRWFLNCANLKTITYTSGAKTLVGESICQACPKLETINIPSSVTSLLNAAYIARNTSLKSINYDGTIQQWKDLIATNKYFKNGTPSTCMVYCTDGAIKLN